MLTKLGRARQASARAYDIYKQLKEMEDALRAQLFETLKADNLRSAKGADFTASISQTPTVVVKHEPSVIDWLKHAPDIEYDQYVGLKTTNFQGLARSILKGTGEVIPGTEIEVRETISIKSNVKKEKSADVKK